MLNSHISTCSDFIANIFLEEEALIQRIRKGQREFVQAMTSKILDERTLTTVTDLYDGKNSRRPSGKEVLSLCGWLQEELVGVTRQSKLLLKREKIRLGKIAAEVEILKE